MRCTELGRRWFVVLCCLLAACNSDQGPTRYRLEGEVTYRGKPLPKGTILFKPDSASGHQGPGGSAEVVDGKYRTLDGMGTIGGKHIADITGYDGVPFQDGPQMNPMGHLLFMQYSEPVDLPQKDAVHDFHIK